MEERALAAAGSVQQHHRKIPAPGGMKKLNASVEPIEGSMRRLEGA
jgi:hypothetical protein